MAELTRERRRALRDQVQLYGFTKSGMKHAELLALFDAADERDRLREELRKAVSMFDRDDIKGYRLLGRRTNAATE